MNVARYQMVPIDFLPSFIDPDSSLYAYYVIPGVAILELCRRFMWAAIRYERLFMGKVDQQLNVTVRVACKSTLATFDAHARTNSYCINHSPRKVHSAFVDKPRVFSVCAPLLGRVENEHLSNAFGYRDSDFVPLHFEPPVATEAPRTSRRVIVEALVFIVVVLVVSVVAAISN